MKIFLAGIHDKPYICVDKALYILESFYYIKDWQLKLIHRWKGFLLDSGAFTFMSSDKGKIHWDEYVERYAEFINKYSIEHFFELDIDSIVGIEEVERLRCKLESLTSRQCIPVWHRSRGKDYWIKMCEEYRFVAIGGLATKEILPQEYPYLNWFIRQAHARGSKVHGLGFTSMKFLPLVHFDSVDSTNWISGGRFGQLHLFEDNKIRSVSYKNRRVKDYRSIDCLNFLEWIKFQEYAEKKL